MAGTLAVIPVRDEAKKSTAMKDQWEVQFSRFFSYPSPVASKCPDLVPLPRYLRDRGSVGTWLAASSPAQLRLAAKPSGACAAVLDVSLGGALLEEHYVTKLHFSWPQVKCISGFPARGARAVFVSYKDSAGEGQKFGVRFLTTSDAEGFVSAVKDIFKGESDIKPFSTVHETAIPSQTEFMSQQASEVLRVTNPVTDYTPELPASSSVYTVEQLSLTQETMPLIKFESNFAALPPSFTALLTDYCPIAEHVAAGCLTEPEDVALKSQIAKYMEDASFHDMLIKVERVINDLGGGEYMM